jgi:hypothetical protein
MSVVEVGTNVLSLRSIDDFIIVLYPWQLALPAAPSTTLTARAISET